MTRRSLLRNGAALAAAAWAAGCSTDRTTGATNSIAPDSATTPAGTTPDSTTATADEPQTRLLLVYFSRAGENYFYGDRTHLDVGNTHVVAEMIASTVDADVYRIEAADPYSDSYDDTVARNTSEQDADARPAIANPLPDVDRYDTILLGSPIWNVRPPMIMHTFIESVDLTNKTLVPFVTYAVSGLGTTIDDYTRAAPTARIGEGLAVRGEETADAQPAITNWLQRAGLLR